MKYGLKLIPVVAILLMVACGGGPEKEFDQASKLNTIEAYENFILNNPDHALIDSAKVNIRLLTVIESENIGLLQKYFKGEVESDLDKQAHMILTGQIALQSGDFKELDIDSISNSDLAYGKDLAEILTKINASSTPNILKKAKSYADRGYVGELFEQLLKIQAIVDNRLIRHTMAELLNTASQKMKMPTTIRETESFQRKMSTFSGKLGSDNLKLGSMNDNPDFGNVCIIIPTLTMEARARSMLTEIPMNEYRRGNIGFNGVLQLMEQMGKMAGILNSRVIEGAKLLLGDEYNKLGIKGRYAVLQWLEYLVDEAGFGVTLLVGEIHITLRATIEGENNILLKELAQQLLEKMEKSS